MSLAFPKADGPGCLLLAACSPKAARLIATLPTRCGHRATQTSSPKAVVQKLPPNASEPSRFVEEALRLASVIHNHSEKSSQLLIRLDA